MRKSLIILAVLGLVLVAGYAWGHSGVNYNTTDPTQVDISNLDAEQYTHVEPVLQTDPHKGWWAISLKNMTASAWSSVIIQAGQTDLVAIVQSATPTDVFVDEFGYSNTSVSSTRDGAVSYAGSLGFRTYENGSNGLLWRSATYTFNTALATGQAAKFYVYTDNSYYAGPYASSFSLTLTPTAVPEPGAMLALSAGLIGLAGFIRRRK